MQVELKLNPSLRLWESGARVAMGWLHIIRPGSVIWQLRAAVRVTISSRRRRPQADRVRFRRRTHGGRVWPWPGNSEWVLNILVG